VNDLVTTSLSEAPTQDPNDVDSRPLLNILKEDNQFFLESYSKPQIRVESKDLNEHMYLVVRSLKHNNAKIEYEI